jgi:hypothetical protein
VIFWLILGFEIWMFALLVTIAFFMAVDASRRLEEWAARKELEKYQSLARTVLCLVFVFALAGHCVAQAPSAVEKHSFWDRSNKILFAADAAAQTFDMVATQQAGQRFSGPGIFYVEDNRMARIFVEPGYKTAWIYHYGVNLGGSTLIAYLLHRSGHHRLERLPHIITIYSGASCGASNMLLRLPAPGQRNHHAGYCPAW